VADIEGIEFLLEAADPYGCHPVRNRLMLLLGSRHGLRREEILLLRWAAIDWLNGQILICQVKVSESGIHPLLGDEMAYILPHSCGYWLANQGCDTCLI
jgi:integrase